MPAECSPPEKMFWVYVSLWIANFFSPLLYSGVTTILPSVALDFNSSAATLSLIVMLYPGRTFFLSKLSYPQYFQAVPRYWHCPAYQYEYCHCR